MPIKPRSAPDIIAANALVEAVSARNAMDVPTTLTESVEFGGAPADAMAAPPLPIYTIAIAALAEDRPSQIEDATQHGWRVTTIDGRGKQLVDLSAIDGKAIGVRRGRSADILENAGRLAERSLSEGDEYEPRMIDFGQLGLSALWLHSRDARDRFFKLGRKAIEVSESDLLTEASTRARQFLSASFPLETNVGIGEINVGIGEINVGIGESDLELGV